MTFGSVSAVIIGAGGSAASYKAAKGGMLQLTRQLAVDYAASAVRANGVCPGAVPTNLGQHIWEMAHTWTTVDPSPPTKMKRASDPSEVASAVAVLAVDDASFLTGAAIMVDAELTVI